MVRKNIHQYDYQFLVSKAKMDVLWGLGWRHFGYYFFRYSERNDGQGVFHVEPLRIDLSRFSLSDSQKRILRKNVDLKVEIVPTGIDAEKESLFELHKVRFEDNVPDSLYDFLSDKPDLYPCSNFSVEVRKDGVLVAVSFLDVGFKSSSSVYAMFHPEEGKRSLGLYTMLMEIEYSIKEGFLYYYSGYSYVEPSHYDYKKKFRGLEVYDWETWKSV